MPLYHYCVQPVLAIAFSAVNQAGEWLFALHARSEALCLSLHLSREQAALLLKQLPETASAYKDARFPVSSMSPYSLTHPLLAGQRDWEGSADNLTVLRHESKRMVGIRAESSVQGSPCLVEIWATPEQALALVTQIEMNGWAVSAHESV